MNDIFNPDSFPDLLVGLREPDDAAVWRLDEDRAIVVTTDFFTPVVDDAYDYGSIAAANSLSDVYAMGGQPFLALNVAALPDNLPHEISSEIIRGGAEKAREAGVVIVGGHTVKDKEPKYGLVVIGFVDPRRMLNKSGLKIGDALVLTKPLGFGVTTTALKQEKVTTEDLAEVVDWMKRLNKSASQLAVEFELRGGTDITGFSLLGHGMEMANASGVALKFDFEKIPFTRAHTSMQQRDSSLAARLTIRCITSYRSILRNPSTNRTRCCSSIRRQAEACFWECRGSDSEAFMARAQEMGQAAWVVGSVEMGTGIVVRR